MQIESNPFPMPTRPGRGAARGGSQLPAAIFPPRAYESWGAKEDVPSVGGAFDSLRIFANWLHKIKLLKKNNRKRRFLPHFSVNLYEDQQK